MKKHLIRMAACGVFLLGVGLPFGAGASPHISDFNLDMTSQELSLRNVRECGGRLCGEVQMGGMAWNGAFTVEDGKLAAIALSGPASESYMAAASEALEASPYVLQTALTDKGRFDFRQASAEKGAFSSFLRETGSDACSFAGFVFRGRGSADGTPGNMGCVLALDPAGITLIIMKSDKLTREMNARMGGTHMAAGERDSR